MKYSKKEILEIIKANHRQRLQVEKGFPNEEEIIYELTIRDWIDEMELLEWNELSEYYAAYFEIESEQSELRASMKPENKKTIHDLCDFISKKAIKPKLRPIKLFGSTCQEAAIFRFLKNKLIQENDLANEIRPSSKLRDYIEVSGFQIISETNRISPRILPNIKYEENELDKQLWKLIVTGFAVLLVADFMGDNWLLGGIGIGLLLSSIWIARISYKIPPKKMEFEGLETFRDLVQKIKIELNAAM